MFICRNGEEFMLVCWISEGVHG